MPAPESALDLKANPAVGSLVFSGQSAILWVSAIVQDFRMDGDLLASSVGPGGTARHLLTNI